MNSLLINIVEFLYNNIITVAIITTAFTLLYVTLRLSYLEVKFNRQLSIKKILFGQRRQFKYRTFNVRRIFALVLSVILIGLILVRAYGAPQVIFVRNTTSLQSNEQTIRIYEDFYSKFFSNPFSPNLTTPQPDEISFESIRLENLEGLDFIIETDNRVFVLNEDGLQVLDFVNGRLDYFRTITLDNPNCLIERQVPLGMTLYQDKIIVVSSRSLGQCVTNPNPYVLRENQTVVQVINLSQNFALSDQMVISGHMTALRFFNAQLIVTTNQWIPFAKANFNLGNYLPYYIINNQQTITPIHEIRYIEDTRPNSFVSTTLIDFRENSIEQVSLLSDYRNETVFRNDAIILAFDKFNFNPVSDIFEFRDPVDSLDTAVVQLNIFNDEVYFYRTQIAEGQRADSGSMFITSDGLNIFTTNRFGRGMIHFYNPTLRFDNQQSLSFVDNIEKIQFENNYFYLSLNRQQTNNYVYQYLGGGNLDLVATQNESTFGQFYRSISSNLFLTLSVFDNQRFDIKVLRPNPTLPFLMDEVFSNTWEPIETSFEGSNSILNNIIYDELTQQIYLPIYPFLNIDSSRKILIYNLNRPNQLPIELDLTRVGEFQSPFVYRVVERNGRVYHITPAGYRETLSNDPANIIRRFSFPSP
jgi:hypothetical protein